MYGNTLFFGNVAYNDRITYVIDNVVNLADHRSRMYDQEIVESMYAERRRIMSQQGTRPPPVTVELAAEPLGPPRLRRSLTPIQVTWLARAQGGVRERRPQRRVLRTWERRKNLAR